MITTLAALVLTAAVSADPKAVIDGPNTGRVGDLLVFNALQSTGATSFRWEIHPKGTKGFTPVDGGKRAVFANHDPGEYTIVLATGGEGGGVDLVMHSVIIGEHLIDPTTNALKQLAAKKAAVQLAQAQADPIDTSELVEMSDTSGASFNPRSAPDAKILAVRWTTKVTSQSKKRDAVTLAGTFRQAAGLVASGHVASSEELSKATSNLATKALGTAGTAWTPWFGELTKHLDAMAASGRLGSMDDYRSLWNRLADGLETVN